jgi:hypothetical protein
MRQDWRDLNRNRYYLDQEIEGVYRMRLISGRLLFGLVIVVVGVLLLLNNLNVGVQFNVRELFRYWPVIPLILGINWLFLSFGSQKTETGGKVFFSWGQFVTALLFIAIGVIYLGRNLGFFTFNTTLFWNLLWPLILILIGISLLRGRSISGGGTGRVSIMSGSKIGSNQSWKLESGSYFAFMGGIDIDLSLAEIEAGETVLDLTAIMGGIEVKVPPDLAIICDGSAILGGVSFLGQEDGGIVGGRRFEKNITDKEEKVLRIQARAVMGGVDIKEVR